MPLGAAEGARRTLMLVSNGYRHDPRVRAEAESLAAAGWEVHVLAWDREGRHATEEVLAGVIIHRVRTEGLLRALPRDLLRLPLLWRRLAQMARRRWPRDHFRLVHAHDLDMLPAGARIAEAWGLPLLYDAHEDWPAMVARDVPAWVARRFERLERRLAPRVAHLIYAAPPTLPALLSRGLPRDRSTAVLNCKALPARAEAPARPGGRFQLAYIGILSPSRLVDRFPEVARRLPEADLVVAGRGPVEPRIAAAARELPNLRFLGEIPSEDVLATTQRADAVLACYDPADPNSRVGVPNKLFEAMACGRPLVGCAGTASGAFIEEHRLGVLAEPTAEGIAAAARRLATGRGAARDMGERGRALAEREYNWDAQAAKLLAVYERLAGGA